MTNDGWSKDWPSITNQPTPVAEFDRTTIWPSPTPNPTTDPEGFVESLGEKLGWPVLTGMDLATGDRTVLTTFDNGAITHKVINPKEYNNKVPTHDPYTNPNAHIYHECACGAILDPGTKSFAALNNAASNAGWKIRWGVEHYQAYCVECGEDME